MKNLLPLVCTFLVGTAAGQVPVPLLDPVSPEAAPARAITNWKEIAPILKEAAECRRTVRGTPPLRALLPTDGSPGLEISVPTGFTVFDLPVQSVTLTRDTTMSLVVAHPAAARERLASVAPEKPVGRLSVNESLPLISVIVCATGSK